MPSFLFRKNKKQKKKQTSNQQFQLCGACGKLDLLYIISVGSVFFFWLIHVSISSCERITEMSASKIKQGSSEEGRRKNCLFCSFTLVLRSLAYA